MLLNKLLKAIQPVQVTGESDIEITGINIDSRLVEAGQLFMAMRGTQADGHAYIPTAIEKGAVAVLCEDMPEEPVAGITYIQVKDSEDATGKIATTFYGDPTSKMELVGVTGTNGKTTIATLLYNTFRYFGYKVGLISTVCNYIDDEAIPTEHTTPDPITLNRLLGKIPPANFNPLIRFCAIECELTSIKAYLHPSSAIFPNNRFSVIGSGVVCSVGIASSSI